MVQARHSLNIWALAIFFLFATRPAGLHYFSIPSIHWLFSPQDGRCPFSLYFFNSFRHLTILTDYPPFSFSSASPHSPSLFLLTATECYPLRLTFFTVLPVVALSFSKWGHLSNSTSTTLIPDSLPHSQFYPSLGHRPQHQPLPPLSHSTNSDCIKSPMRKGVLWGLLLSRSFPASSKHGQK